MVFREVIKVKGEHQGRTLINGTVVPTEEKRYQEHREQAM
jgi:hypothetical protein